jgi:hypothetical protein
MADSKDPTAEEIISRLGDSSRAVLRGLSPEDTCAMHDRLQTTRVGILIGVDVMMRMGDPRASLVSQGALATSSAIEATMHILEKMHPEVLGRRNVTRPKDGWQPNLDGPRRRFGPGDLD